MNGQRELLLHLLSQAYKKTQEKLGIKINEIGPLLSMEASQEDLLTYIQKIYTLLLQSFGPDVARTTFEKELQAFKKNHGFTEEYASLLKILPIPVMSEERLALLSRSELENELRVRIKELEEIKTNLENIVAERTQLVSAERNKLLVILYNINDAVITVDLEGNIVTFNKAAEFITGYTASEIIGKPIHQVVHIFDMGQEVPYTTYCPAKKDEFEGVVYIKQNVKLIGINNKEAFVDFTTGQIKEGIGVNLGNIFTVHDITKEKQIEKMKLDFVSMAAHELRTPLTSIKGYLSVFIDENQNKMDEHQKVFLNRMNIATEQLSALIENLLSVTKMERGAFSVHKEVTDWVFLVKQTVAEFKTRAEEKHITLSFDEPLEQIPPFSIDGLRSIEVLSNLLANAITYTPSGGKIQVWVEKKPDTVVTHVQDTGIGIPKEALPNMFTKFFRVSGPLEKGAKGTGLGLYIAKAIMDAHKGSIWVASEEGKGSTFSFSFPINAS